MDYSQYGQSNNQYQPDGQNQGGNSYPNHGQNANRYQGRNNYQNQRGNSYQNQNNNYQNQPQGSQNQNPLDPCEQLCSFAFTSNHILTLSLMELKPEKPSRKERFFFFLTMAPGEGQGGNRTYNFKNRITQKVSLRTIGSIAFCLKQASCGNFQSLPFISFTRSGNDHKQFEIFREQPRNNQSNQPGQSNQIPGLMVGMKHGNLPPIYIKMSFAEAYSFGQQLEMLFNKGMELEIDYQFRNPQLNTRQNQYQNDYPEESDYPPQDNNYQQSQPAYAGAAQPAEADLDNIPF